MKMYVVMWTVFNCPGGWFGGMIPKALKPLVCESKPAYEFYDPAQLDIAHSRIIELGQGSDLHKCIGKKCRSIVKWLPFFEE